MSLWQHLSAHISQSTGEKIHIRQQQSLGGGCINNTLVVSDGAALSYFVKTNHADRHPMFAAEALGLQELQSSQTVRVPQVICAGVFDQKAYLVLEYISLQAEENTTQSQLGTQLAALHRVTQNQYGWKINNTIGTTPQINTLNPDWINFWREQRLGLQLQWAANQGYAGQLQQQGEKLLSLLDSFFQDYIPTASLLHGDLWAGNHGADAQGNPVIFDPAVYYGDRETDLAMTTLFGGFSTHFYRAYQEHYPLHAGYALRKNLYNLYHVLNHLNLFGGAYLPQALSLIQKLLVEVE